MLPLLNVWGLSIDLTLVLLVGYIVALWAGGWALESLARAHFRRAQRHAHDGFAYDEHLDRYECPQGELLTLDTYDDRDRLAIYRAPASSCNACPLMTFCAPHGEGRRVYHSLAEFHETDVGRFHRRLSLTILGVALAFSAAGLVAWWSRPGEWLLAIASGVSIVLLWLDIRDDPQRPSKSPEMLSPPDGAP
ncbi:MAG: hypothetical protein ACYC61_19120 [Isosphaeraceae bacterium]